MKKTALVLTFALICAGIAACGEIPELPTIPEEHAAARRDLVNAQSSIFNTLEVNDGDSGVVTADLDVYLAETDADFLFIEAAEDTPATLHYTYTTYGQDGVRLGCALDGTPYGTTLHLTAATEAAFDGFWFDEEITLLKGMNRMYLSGEKQTCKMRLEVRGLDRDQITYVSGSPKEEG